MYAKGKGVSPDYEEAAKWYLKAGEQGDADAQNNLGLMYADGRGVPRDCRTANCGGTDHLTVEVGQWRRGAPGLQGSAKGASEIC